MLVSVSVYWYCVRLRRPPTVMFCGTCMKNLAPSMPATFLRNRWMICSAVASRWS